MTGLVYAFQPHTQGLFHLYRGTGQHESPHKFSHQITHCPKRKPPKTLFIFLDEINDQYLGALTKIAKNYY
jgi:hypothetical protein